MLPFVGGHASIEAGRILPDTNILQAIFDGSYAPFLSHVFLSLFFIVPMTYSLITKRISHVCSIKITGWLIGFGGFLLASVLFTSFWLLTVQTILDWALMAASFFAVALCCGRRMSLYPLVGYALATIFVSLLGIMEYNGTKAIDPGWRIFALQVGPNQAGALFAMGLCACLGLSVTFERLARLGLLMGAFLNGLALALTQSKGAIYCLPLGLIALLVVLLILKPVKPSAALATVVAGGVLFAAGLGMAVKGAQVQSGVGGAGAVSRMSNVSESSVQSSEFRKLLWFSAIDLIKARPQGWGMGTFWYESTRPGRVTQTTLAHQTFLQLGAEATFFAPIGLIGFLGAVAVMGFKGAKKLSSQSKVLLATATGAMAVALAHNMVDSDMYVFGLGSFVFLLAGVVVATSADSQAPEYVFRAPKVGFAASVFGLLPVCLLIGIAELNRAQARGAVDARDGAAVVSHANTAMMLAFADGQAAAIKALATRSEEDLVTATRFHPAPKAFRALAEYYLAKQDYQGCFRALKHALERDPNNAPALKKFYQTALAAGDPEMAVEYAQKLIDTESTTYFTVRSQPDFIPLQTYEARVFLAELPKNTASRSKMLGEALSGYRDYRDKTVPTVLRMMGGNKQANIAGEDMQSMNDNLTEGKHVLTLLGKENASNLGIQFDEELRRFDDGLEALNK